MNIMIVCVHREERNSFICHIDVMITSGHKKVQLFLLSNKFAVDVLVKLE